MKNQPYTELELRDIRDNMHLTDNEIAEMLGRTRSGVAIKRWSMGLEKKKSYTTKDLRFIEDNMDLTDAELAEELNRSKSGIFAFRKLNNLMKRPEYKRHNKQKS